MIIDCDGCLARGPACQDCVVTVVLGPEVEAHPARGSGQAAAPRWKHGLERGRRHGPGSGPDQGPDDAPDQAGGEGHVHGRRFPVPVLVSGPRLPMRGSGQVDLDAAERAAIAVLSSSGLVPPLRAVPGPVDRGGSQPSAHAG